MSVQVGGDRGAFGNETVSRGIALAADRRMSIARYALLATPDLATGDTLAGLVAAHGLAAVVVRDGAAAVAMLRERGTPAITIVELALPMVDGFAVIRALRVLAPAATSPAVAVSSNLALRTRAMDLRGSLGIGAVLSMQLPVPRIDQLLRPLLAPPPRDPVGPVPMAAPAAPPSSPRPGVVEPPMPALQGQLVAIARLFGVSSVLVALDVVGPRRLRAHHGEVGDYLATRGTERDLAFCTPQVVPSAFDSPVFAGHPLLAAGLIGSYVGVPVVSRSGSVLGTLGVVDAGAWLGSPDLVDALRMEGRGIGRLLVGAATLPSSLAAGSQPLAPIPDLPALRGGLPRRVPPPRVVLPRPARRP